VHQELPGATVTFRSAALAALAASPLQQAAEDVFGWGIVVAAGFSAMIMLMSLAIEARAREAALAWLMAMGLAVGRARWMAAFEVLPAVLTTAIVGSLCGWLLVPLAGPVLDLSVFTGGTVSVPVRVQVLPAVLAAGGLVALAMIVLLVRVRPVRHPVLLRTLRESG
jgi:hypothetical protein